MPPLHSPAQIRHAAIQNRGWQEGPGTSMALAVCTLLLISASETLQVAARGLGWPSGQVGPRLQHAQSA